MNSVSPLASLSSGEIDDARARIADSAIRSPLLRLDAPGLPFELWLKLECLQPIGSFKIRGAANAMALADPAALARGVYTGSAGNMAQGVAFAARRLGVPCRVVMPDRAPRAKLDAVRRMGATAVRLPFEEWWAVLRDHGHPEERGHFIHPVSDRAVIAGNGTVGLEIAEELPGLRAVVVPYGGGGLACGIASALRDAAPDARVFAAEVETAAPFAASLRAGRPVDVRHQPSFVDGIGAAGVLREMWPLARGLLAGSIVVTLREVRAAVRVLARRARIVAEGAGAVAAAASLRGMRGVEGGAVVAVVSGGNIDAHILRAILEN